MVFPKEKKTQKEAELFKEMGIIREMDIMREMDIKQIIIKAKLLKTYYKPKKIC